MHAIEDTFDLVGISIEAMIWSRREWPAASMERHELNVHARGTQWNQTPLLEPFCSPLSVVKLPKPVHLPRKHTLPPFAIFIVLGMRPTPTVIWTRCGTSAVILCINWLSQRPFLPPSRGTKPTAPVLRTSAFACSRIMPQALGFSFHTSATTRRSIASTIEHRSIYLSNILILRTIQTSTKLELCLASTETQDASDGCLGRLVVYDCGSV